MALAQRTKTTTVIHHSDRGVQYCSFDYVDLLRKNNCSISMTKNGEAYENPIAERVNGILKTEFNLSQVFKSTTDALIAVQRSIHAYNNLRPHMSCDYLTPNVAHLTTEPLVKHCDTTREATSDEVAELRKENQRLKELVADLMLRHDILKKSTQYLA